MTDEATIQIPPYSKTTCAKFLKQGFGHRTHYRTLPDGGLAVVVAAPNGSEYHLLEVRPKVAEAAKHLPWLALVAAFRTQGFDPIPYRNRLEFVSLEPSDRDPGSLPVPTPVEPDADQSQAISAQ